MTAPDIDSFETYGGHKENYAPVEDPVTDRDALDVNAAMCSTAAMTHTATKAWARVVCSASTPVLASTNPCDGLWPNINANLPAPTRNGTGDFTVTWPTTVEDEDGVTHTLAFRAARCTIEGTTFGFVTAVADTPHSIRVRLANTAGSANDFAGITILVEAL